MLDEMLAEIGTQLDVVLELVVDDEEVVRRLSGRRTCRTCGHIWHVDFDPPTVEGVCDVCGGELFQRDDDKPETVRHRLEVYARADRPADRLLRRARASWSASTRPGPVDDVTERASRSAARLIGRFETGVGVQQVAGGEHDPDQVRATRSR